MDTQGNKIHRNKGRFIAWYERSDSHPDGIGLHVLEDIPSSAGSPQEFRELMAGMQKWPTDVLEKLEEGSLSDDDQNYIAMEEQPLIDDTSGQPELRLEDVLTKKRLLSTIGFDHSGHFSYPPKEDPSNGAALPPPSSDSVSPAISPDHASKIAPATLCSCVHVEEQLPKAENGDVSSQKERVESLAVIAMFFFFLLCCVMASRLGPIELIKTE